MKRNYGIDTVSPETVSAASSAVETEEDE
jgi:hypothetical protein